MPEGACTLGIDCGTSGLRGAVVDAAGAVRATAHRPFPAGTTDPAVWASACDAVIAELAPVAPVRALAIDGTSGTLLLTDTAGNPLGPALLYNDPSAADLASTIATLAPPESAAHGATSPAASPAWWFHPLRRPWQRTEGKEKPRRDGPAGSGKEVCHAKSRGAISQYKSQIRRQHIVPGLNLDFPANPALEPRSVKDCLNESDRDSATAHGPCFFQGHRKMQRVSFTHRKPCV